MSMCLCTYYMTIMYSYIGLHVCLKIKQHCVSKNDSDVTHYNFNAHEPIFAIFGRDIAERICY